MRADGQFLPYHLAGQLVPPQVSRPSSKVTSYEVLLGPSTISQSLSRIFHRYLLWNLCILSLLVHVYFALSECFSNIFSTVENELCIEIQYTKNACTHMHVCT